LFQLFFIILDENGIKKMQIKTIPSIYHTEPSEEIQYACFTQASLIRRDTLSVIDLSQVNRLAKGRKRGIKTMQNKLVVKEENDFKQFWNKI
jgi:hypothetical protein